MTSIFEKSNFGFLVITNFMRFSNHLQDFQRIDYTSILYAARSLQRCRLLSNLQKNMLRKIY